MGDWLIKPGVSIRETIENWQRAGKAEVA